MENCSIYKQPVKQNNKNKKSSSALRRNNILKNKVGTPFWFFLNPFQTALRTSLPQRTGCRLGEQGGGEGRQESRRVTMGSCTLKHHPQSWIKASAFIKIHKLDAT